MIFDDSTKNPYFWVLLLTDNYADTCYIVRNLYNMQIKASRAFFVHVLEAEHHFIFVVSSTFTH